MSVEGEPAAAYDRRIVALGSISRNLLSGAVRGASDRLKSILEALHLRDTLLRSLEIAETIDEPDIRAQYLTFVVAGGGYTGVEVIAEAQDLAAEILHLYPCAAQGMRRLLVESGDRIMREVPEDLGDFTVTELRRRGIEVLVGTRLQGVTEASVQLSDEQRSACRPTIR